ncbi:MAG: porin, partial [Glaciimonas sp.]|nr:porin [Glaciimonas sp.]
IYSNGPIAAYLAYYQARAGKQNSDTGLNYDNGFFAPNYADGDIASKTFSLGGSYQAGPARLYANWSRVTAQPGTAVVPKSNHVKKDIYEIGTAYSLTAPLKLLASVQHVRYTVSGDTGPKPSLTQINLGTDYWLSKRTDVYAFASHAMGKNRGTPDFFGDFAASSVDGGREKSNQSSVSVGIRHKF